MPHVVPVCVYWGKCQADGVAWLLEGGHARFALTSPSTLNKEVIFYHWSLVLCKLSLNILAGTLIQVRRKQSTYLLAILDAILSDDNGHGHLFAHIHKHKQKQRSEKVLCVSQRLTLFEQHDPLRGNLIQPVGESLRSFFPQFNRDTWGKHCSLHPTGSPFFLHRPQEESHLINPLIIRTHCLLKTVRRSSDGARDSCTGDKCSTVELVLGCRAFYGSSGCVARQRMGAWWQVCRWGSGEMQLCRLHAMKATE